MNIVRRQPSGLPTGSLHQLNSTSDMQVLRDLVTQALLRAAGLRIAREGDSELDSHLPLTAVQRRRIHLVKTFGYRVKLMDDLPTPMKGHH